MAPALQFDEAEHVYSLNGVAVPGVTSVLEDVGISDYSRIPDGPRLRALERGRFVHSLTHFDDEGALDQGSIDPALVGYLEAWRRFRDELKFEPTLIEHRGYCATYGYAGTLDRVGTMGGSMSDVLADIKTGAAPYWVAYQTAAYANFMEQPAKYRRMAVELHRDGTFKVYEYRCRDFSSDLNVFLSALAVYVSKRRGR